MAAEIGRRREHAVDWSSRTDQEQVLVYLYQKLVCYEERTVGFAIRLDKSEDDESRDFVHPLVRALASDGGGNPLAILVEREIQQTSRVEQRNCLATAYVQLLRTSTTECSPWQIISSSPSRMPTAAARKPDYSPRTSSRLVKAPFQG